MEMAVAAAGSLALAEGPRAGGEVARGELAWRFAFVKYGLGLKTPIMQSLELPRLQEFLKKILN